MVFGLDILAAQVLLVAFGMFFFRVGNECGVLDLEDTFADINMIRSC